MAKGAGYFGIMQLKHRRQSTSFHLQSLIAWGLIAYWNNFHNRTVISGQRFSPTMGTKVTKSICLLTTPSTVL